jgi:8-oxo-dGTP pyrophosphatase MutT (NUDIX family)
MMISFQAERNKFSFRAACIILNGDKVLLQKPIHDEQWFLPGGRVEFSESAENALKRELIEELDIHDVECKLIWIVENFLEFKDLDKHEIGMFYYVVLPESHSILRHEVEFVGVENDYVNRWIKIEELENYYVVPEFVVPELKKLDVSQGIKHIINKAKR